MSGELSTADLIMNEIDVSLETARIETQPDLPVPPNLAERGKAAVTSLYAESFLAVDELPKRPIAGLFSRIGITKQAQAHLELVGQHVEINPLYDGVSYQRGKGWFDWSKNKNSNKEVLTDRSHKESFAELGLAALHNGVLFGFSKYEPNERQWRWMKPARLIATMALNGSLDRDVTESLKDIRRAQHYPQEDYITALLSLANRTTQAIIQPPERITIDRSNYNAARRKAFCIYSSVVGAGSAEVVHVFASGNPKLGISAAAIGALSGIIGGDILISKKIKSEESR